MQSEIRGSVGILGFGVDGQGVAEWLAGKPEVERVVVFDDKEERGKRKEERGKIVFGGNLQDVDTLFRSPGFPLTHPLIAEAKNKGIPVTSSTRQVLKNFEGVTVGITGSNGKTTCTALIEEFLKAEYGSSMVERGGNDGVPRLDLIREKREKRKEENEERKVKSEKYLVLELSSFQLIDSEFSPNVAVVLNITPNHLDWHKDMAEYAEAKRQIVAHSSAMRKCENAQMRKLPDIAILNQDDPLVRDFSKNTLKDIHWFTDDVPWDQIRVKSHPDTIRAAVTAARALKVSEANILKVLREFKGVPHRIEFVREFDGIKYYNDSSCTTPESAIVACQAFPKGSLTVLLGGRDKKMDFSGLYTVIAERDVAVVPYGEMAKIFERNIPTSYPTSSAQGGLRGAGKLQATSFTEVIDAARSVGRPNVVLSPACASFDMFKNAKERGKIFEEIVRGM